MTAPDCAACEERLADFQDGSLGPVVEAEVRGHLARCAACRELEAAMGRARKVLRAVRPTVAADETLARSIAAATWTPPAAARRSLHALTRYWPLAPEHGGPPWRIQAVAGLMSMVVSGAVAVGVTAWSDPHSLPGRAARLTSTAASDFRSRTDGWVEDLHLLKVLMSTAFEGRADRIQEQVQDYQEILERRRQAQPSPSPGTPDRTPGASAS